MGNHTQDTGTRGQRRKEIKLPGKEKADGIIDRRIDDICIIFTDEDKKFNRRMLDAGLSFRGNAPSNIIYERGQNRGFADNVQGIMSEAKT